MSYDLAVWVGQAPPDDATAAAEFEERFDVYEGSEDPLSPALVAFVAVLLERFPEGKDDGVWALEPVLDDEGGDFLCLTMVVNDQLDDVVSYAAQVGSEHGLVVYDPQQECLARGGTSDSESESWLDWELPEVSPADMPDRVDHAMAAEVLGINLPRAVELFAELDAGPHVELPFLITGLLMHDHHDMALPDSVWRSMLSVLRPWWATVPDLVQGREWLSTDGHRALLLRWPEQSTPDWEPICQWYLTSVANMLVWKLREVQRN